MAFNWRKPIWWRSRLHRRGSFARLGIAWADGWFRYRHSFAFCIKKMTLTLWVSEGNYSTGGLEFNRPHPNGWLTPLDIDMGAIFAKNTTQNMANLTEGNFMLYRFDKDRHQVLRTVGGAFNTPHQFMYLVVVALGTPLG